MLTPNLGFMWKIKAEREHEKAPNNMPGTCWQCLVKFSPPRDEVCSLLFAAHLLDCQKCQDVFFSMFFQGHSFVSRTNINQWYIACSIQSSLVIFQWASSFLVHRRIESLSAKNWTRCWIECTRPGVSKRTSGSLLVQVQGWVWQHTASKVPIIFEGWSHLCVVLSSDRTQLLYD